MEAGSTREVRCNLVDIYPKENVTAFIEYNSQQYTATLKNLQKVVFAAEVDFVGKVDELSQAIICRFTFPLPDGGGGSGSTYSTVDIKG